MLRLVLFLLALGASAAAAQITEFGEFKRAETRFGVLSVTPDRFEEYLTLNGQPVGLRDRFVWIAGAWAYPGEQADWVLLSSAHGGNMCPYSSHLMRVTAQGVRLTPALGGCLSGPVALRVLAGRVELDMADPDLRVSHQTFAWDGAGAVTQTAMPAQLGAAPAADQAQVTAHVGRHPANALRDPAIQALFLRVMSADELETLSRHVAVANPVTQRGDWVVGQGCFAHRCNTQWGVWAIRLADLTVTAQIFARGGQGAWFNAPAVAGDATWRQIQAEVAAK